MLLVSALLATLSNEEYEKTFEISARVTWMRFSNLVVVVVLRVLFVLKNGCYCSTCKIYQYFLVEQLPQKYAY